MFIKFKYIIIFIVASVICGSCTGDDREFISRDLSVEFQIPAGLNTIESHFFKISNVPIFYTETLSNNGLDVNTPKEVSGLRALIRSKFNDVDLSSIERISVFIVNKSNRTDRVEIFYNEQIPFNQNREIRLLSNISNFYSYIKDNSIDLEVRIKFRGFLQIPVQGTLDFSYLVYI